MDHLYIEIHAEEGSIFTSIKSYVALYVYLYLEQPQNIKLHFVLTTAQASNGKIPLNRDYLKLSLNDERIIHKDTAVEEPLWDLHLPIYNKDNDTYIAGMCAVCREIVLKYGTEASRKLLGFKESCLLATTEASIWTRFCEVNIVAGLSDVLKSIEGKCCLTELPVECVRFENHMGEPVRMHNIYKLAREKANVESKKKVTIECTTPKDQLSIEHTFVEGVQFTIGDLILYPCVRLLFIGCGLSLLDSFPLTKNWFANVDNYDSKCLQILNDTCMLSSLDGLRKVDNELKIPQCPAASFYKSDPKRYKPRNRIYTEQKEVDAALDKLQNLDIHFSSTSTCTYDKFTIDWQCIEPSHAKSSALPEKRLARKRQQLENLANAVVSLANPGDRIVDFCSGTGHLGILLALQLPLCTVILLENKSISLQRAKCRVLELQLKNVIFYQSNIDYFEGKFDIGCSLHACGTGTDIVLAQCRRANANFVCCPCCYGSLQPMPHIKYPLSKEFRSALSENEYMYIAHTADQAHALGTLNCSEETTRQGQLCMDIVDTDRKLQAENAGYNVILTRLKPENCTPKNRLLVGRKRTHEESM
ncbi:glutathione S-transferase C-terminal domain-containing protein homolog [Musca vetustissima]|uniref:glutathione S-transferase C-terminal domain-containing protein homolog n=1 Tax=Musca vetustissima TaxID=27455 RepID=UPI002AB6253E|nr:glutathione S-transferase C-terminal domain-containing protein homolog [Musca vetustissima]